MSRPIALSNGVYHLNVRVPADVLDKVRGTQVWLPVDKIRRPVKLSGKALLSLRTKDPGVAKTRFAEAYQALVAHFEAVRAGPKPLTHKEIVALAGEVYHGRIAAHENDISFPWSYDEELEKELKAIAAVQNEPGNENLNLEEAQALVTLDEPNGPELLAFLWQQDIEIEGTKVSHEQALARLFGQDVEVICAKYNLNLDDLSRKRLILEIGKAVHLAAAKINLRAEGDYSPDPNAARFPTFEPQNLAKQVPVYPKSITLEELYALWKKEKADKLAASTLRRYASSIKSLCDFLKGRDIRAISDDDIYDWAVHRRDKDGVSASSVNTNDLVAAAALFTFAMSRDAKKLRKDNPVKGVKLGLPKKRQRREEMFRPHEIEAILKLARGVKTDKHYPRASASRRWAPWVCAYSGARIQEVCWLTKDSIWCEKGIWVMQFPMTKDGYARKVAIHDALIEEGFLEFWKGAPEGDLFIDDIPRKEDRTRTSQEQRASEVSSWIRENTGLDPGVDPSHGWRHTFITYAHAAGISKRMANAIAGHNKKKDASDGYYHPLPSLMKADLDTFPRYQIE